MFAINMFRVFLWLFLFFAVILLVVKIYIKLLTGWCKSYTCLVGKTVIVTGSNTGIGYFTALEFAKRGAKVILACRCRVRGQKAQERIILATGNSNVHLKIVDFSSLQSVRDFCRAFNKNEPRLDILVNNAGCFGLENYCTIDGLQVTWQVNYLAPFLLTNMLIDKLKKSAPSRIVNLASAGAKLGNLEIEEMKKSSNGNTAFKYCRNIYCTTKQTNILFNRELALRLSGTGVTTYAVHPGVVFTDIFRTLPSFIIKRMNLIMKTPEEGAQTTLHCALSKDLVNTSGKLYAECAEISMYKTCRDLELAKELWKNSENAVNLTIHDKNLID